MVTLTAFPQGSSSQLLPVPSGHKELLEKLLVLGLINTDQAHIALTEHRYTSKALEVILVDLGFITESTLTTLMAELSGIQHLSLRETVLDVDLVRQVPRTIAESFLAIPVSQIENHVLLAMADVDDVTAYDQVRRYLPIGADIQRVVASRADILEAVQGYYGFEMSLSGLLREIEQTQTLPACSEKNGLENPTVRLVNALILDAVKKGASDIHCEPEGAFVRIRYRLDGLLHPTCAFHKTYWPALCVRLKVMAEMNIAESRRPQNGRFSCCIMGREVDFRVSSHPTVYGENLVIRILDKSRSLIQLEALGYTPFVTENLQKCLERPSGLIIVTGPTGSGKTTSLYSMLSLVSSDHVNVMTLEEPVEYRLPLLRQTDIREQIGFTFAEGVKSILRQDPDIILIGEIRDAPTAQMALRAAMTGHQVFTTLHTQDALGAVHRLLDLGISSSLLVGNIMGIVAQRLVRVLCAHCKKYRNVTPRESLFLKVSERTLVCIPGSCAACQGTGYSGRSAVAEILPFDEGLETLILQGASPQAMKLHARQHGFLSLFEDGLARVLEGETSFEEIRRVVGLPELIE